jgi:hypothetical protein
VLTLFDVVVFELAVWGMKDGVRGGLQYLTLARSLVSPTLGKVTIQCKVQTSYALPREQYSMHKMIGRLILDYASDFQLHRHCHDIHITSTYTRAPVSV